MSSHFLTDKSLSLEQRFLGTAVRRSKNFAEPGVAPRFGPDRGFELDHVDLELSLDLQTAFIEGRAELRIRPLPTGLGAVVLDLGDVELLEVLHAEGHVLSWRREDRQVHVSGVPDHGGVLQFRYRGTPRRGIYFTGPIPSSPERQRMAWTQCQDEDGHHLFPCIDHPSIKCTWNIHVIVDEKLTVVSNGECMDIQQIAEGKKRWTWHQTQPIPAYLVTIAAGEFEVMDAKDSPVPARYLAPRDTEHSVIERVFSKTPEMIRWMTERLGVEYPWPRYDQVVVHDFIFGGMENAGATTLTDLALTDERASLDWNADDLLLHELAHQWFGDLVTCSDWSQAWLNEGWATYSEYLWRCHDLGQEEADLGLFKQLGNYLGEASGRYCRCIVHYHYRKPIDLFDRHLYEKGSLVLHTLRHTIGDDAFFEGTRIYLRKHAFGSVHTRDFQRALEGASGRNLECFFQQWIEGAGHPRVTVDSSHARGMLHIGVKQTQSGDRIAKAFHFGLRIRIVHGEESRLVTLPVSDRERSWALVCEAPPDRVEIDADFRLLAELTLTGSVRLLEASLKADASIVGRIRAARALAKKGTGPALRVLLDALVDAPFWGVRAEVASLLATWGGDDARTALLNARNDEHSKARHAIVAALGSFRHPEVHRVLSDIIDKGDPSIQVEGEAGRALGKSHGPEVVAQCERLLERESWGDLIRIRALEGLSHSRNPDALPVLLAWTAIEKSPRAQAAAAAGLGVLADTVPSVREAVLPRLIEIARDGGFRVRLSAIGALGRARLSGAIGALQRIHASDPDGRVQRMSFEALEKIRAGRSGEDGRAHLRSEFETLRKQNRDLRDRLVKLEDRMED